MNVSPTLDGVFPASPESASALPHFQTRRLLSQHSVRTRSWSPTPWTAFLPYATVVAYNSGTPSAFLQGWVQKHLNAPMASATLAVLHGVWVVLKS